MDQKKILIVDDEKAVLAVLEKALTSEGYDVSTADNGKEGIKLAKSEQPGLVILDVLMPDMDGGETARILKNDPETEDIPVMFLTCLLSKEQESNAKDHDIGGHVFIAKPYEISELLTFIEKMMDKKCVHT